MKQRRSCLPGFVLAAALVIVGLFAAAAYVPVLAEKSFGAPSSTLSVWHRFSYAVEMLWNVDSLTVPFDAGAADQDFVIEPGETAAQVSTRLEQSGLIRNAGAFRIYLAWSGIDTSVQIGTYRLSPSLTAIEIAQRLQSTTLTEVKFHVLAGWRLEEIAAALPTSGLSIPPEAFMTAAANLTNPPFYLPASAGAEGLLFPDEYILSRKIMPDGLISTMIQNFTDHLTPDLRDGFTGHGLTIYQAVILASMIQREAVVADEMPLIASVFYNRLAIGMDLQSDPTVQYALGYNVSQRTWWTNPLSLDDLQVDSPYNTYVYSGLPPGPISNPGLEALQAVANPADSTYLFFRARCDGSGRHAFAETMDQQVQNACP